jgi:hypothetical protein
MLGKTFLLQASFNFWAYTFKLPIALQATTLNLGKAFPYMHKPFIKNSIVF